jgi:hypothetical protein
VETTALGILNAWDCSKKYIYWWVPVLPQLLYGLISQQIVDVMFSTNSILPRHSQLPFQEPQAQIDYPGYCWV